ncbi:efflux transporter, RND family, MFP subunit [compost metagenome]
MVIADTDVADAKELQVPMGALYDAGKGPGVWVVGGEAEQVAWRPIKVRGLNNEASVRVTGDLQVGDRVVALGAHLLSEGEKVRTELADAPQNSVVEVSR